MLSIGDAVTFVDQLGIERPAILTAVWSGNLENPVPNPSVNLVVVSLDEERRDMYGRQIIRETSVPHQSNQVAPGFYWK